MQREYSIKIYTTYKNQIPKISFVQHDTLTNKIQFEMFDDINVPMTDIATATATVKREDGNTYTYGMTNEDGTNVFEIVDNLVTFILPPSSVFVAGNCKASISLYDTNNGKITTQTFNYTVTESLVADTPIDETNQYPILASLIKATNDAADNFKSSGATGFEAEVSSARHDNVNNTDYNNLGARLDNLTGFETEVTSARHDNVNNINYNNLGARLDNLAQGGSGNGNTTFQTYEGEEYTINNPYANIGKNSYKGNIHCHTTCSDGVFTPTALAQKYKDAGFNFLAITDHHSYDTVSPYKDYTVATDPNISGITWLGKSCEELGGQGHPHITAINIGDTSPIQDSYSVINYHKNLNELVGFAHPNDNNGMGTPIESLKLMEYNFLEIYNGSYYYPTDSKQELMGYAENLWDKVLSLGKHIFGVAVDDFHNDTDTPLGRGYIVAYANNNTKDEIISSIRNGQFYSSQGNDISISLNKNVINASSTYPSNFKFISKNGSVLATANNVLTASYTIKGNELYVRVEAVRVLDNKKAWSQPIFIDLVENDRTKVTTDLVRSNNFLINGSFEICQRLTINPSGIFKQPNGWTLDRWFAFSNASDWQVYQSVQPNVEGNFACALGLITRGSSFSDLYIMQPLENNVSYPMKGKTVTFSCKVVRASDFKTGKLVIGIQTGKGNNEKFVSTNSQTFYKEIPVSQIAYNTKQYELFTTVSMTVTLPMDLKQVGVIIALRDNASPDILQDGSLVYIKDARLQLGIGVDDFYVPRNNLDELLVCQRYYSHIGNENAKLSQSANGKNKVIGTGYAIATNRAIINIPYPTKLRGLASLYYYDFTNYAQYFALTLSDFTMQPISDWSVLYQDDTQVIWNVILPTNNLVVGQSTFFVANKENTYLDFESELL